MGKPGEKKPIEYQVNHRECWICESHARTGGYPIVTIGGRNIRVSRFMFEQTYGPVPLGMVVCHTCDTPACINPEHFFLGTRTDNNRDMAQKGRASRGEEHHHSKLSEDEVLSIFSAPENCEELGAHYGVDQATIYRIKSGQRWGWLTGK